MAPASEALRGRRASERALWVDLAARGFLVGLASVRAATRAAEHVVAVLETMERLLDQAGIAAWIRSERGALDGQFRAAGAYVKNVVEGAHHEGLELLRGRRVTIPSIGDIRRAALVCLPEVPGSEVSSLCLFHPASADASQAFLSELRGSLVTEVGRLGEITARLDEERLRNGLPEASSQESHLEEGCAEVLARDLRRIISQGGGHDLRSQFALPRAVVLRLLGPSDAQLT